MRGLRRQVGGVGARRDGRATCRPGVDPALLVGLAPFDDAAIYRLDDTTALVSTTDFFPPLVDDPADYGAIAAANACSDVFAMGGRVVLAINVAAFPEHFPRVRDGGDLRRRGAGRRRGRWHGRRRAHDPQPGARVRPRRAGPRAPRPGVPQGRRPAGRRRAAVQADRDRAHAGRRQRRRQGRGDRRDARAQPGARRRRCRRSAPAVHAVTDVTGYGLAGHGWEVAERSGVRLVVDSAGLVAYPGAREAAERGVRTGGDARNRDYVAGAPDVDGVGGGRGARARPADVRWAAGGGRPGRRRRRRGRRVLARRDDRGRRCRRWCCGDGACRPSRDAAPSSPPSPRSGRRRAASRRRCGTSATTSSSASTRSAAARGPGR